MFDRPDLPLRRALLRALFLLPLAAHAVEWVGTVVGIADGDTRRCSMPARPRTACASTASTRLSAPRPTASVRVSRWPICRKAVPRTRTARSTTDMGAPSAA
jgi:hypothetical protein